MGIRDKFVGALAGFWMGARSLMESANNAEEAMVKSQEAPIQETASLADIQLSVDAMGWTDLTTALGSWNLDRDTVRKMVALSRIMYLVNPLIKRAVTVQELYVWGGGVKIKADDEDVDEIIRDFFTDRKNQRIIGNGDKGWPEREKDQRLDGNTFFVFFRNKSNGSARVRLLPFDQIQSIISNPDDAQEPWFYERHIPSKNGVEASRVLYPDVDYNPRTRAKPSSFKGIRILWDSPVLHVSTGGLSQMQFGIPELFSAMPWATAYKGILENFATILKAYSRLAMQISGLAGKKGVAAAKSKLNTAISTGNALDTNPPANTAAWATLAGDTKISAIKTAGHTTGPDEARALRSMLAAGSDLPEHFFGDSNLGNFATSSTLDRPTELKMVARQNMWLCVILHMCEKLKEWSAAAPLGKLHKAGFRAAVSRDDFGSGTNVIITSPNGKSLGVVIDFPNILERDVVDRVRAVVQAATLGGSQAEGIIPDRRYLFKLLVTAMGERNIEGLVEEFYPEPVRQGFIDPKDVAKDDKKAAQGKADLGQAALDQADAARKAALNKPKPSGSPLPGASNR